MKSGTQNNCVAERNTNLERPPPKPPPPVLTSPNTPPDETYHINNINNKAEKSCITTKIKRKGGQIRTVQALIDTGNNLPNIAMSMKAYNSLRNAMVIKNNIEKTDLKAASADPNEIKVIGIVRGSWKLYKGKHAIEVKEFIIIENLQHALNVGIRVLRKLGAIIDCKEESITIEGHTIQLQTPKRSPSLHGSNLMEELKPSDKVSNEPKRSEEIRAYNKHAVTIPPHTVALLKLKTYDKEKRDHEHDHKPCKISLDEEYASTNGIEIKIDGITMTDNLTVPVVNDNDNDLIIKKNKRVATIQSFNDDKKKDQSEVEKDTLDEADHLEKDTLDEADHQHFAKSEEERKTFILEKFKLGNKKILDSKEKIDSVVKILLKHWKVLDSTEGGMRIGKIKNIKHKIMLKEGAQLSHQKPRPLNPIIRQQVEEQLLKRERQNVIQKATDFPRHTSPLVPVLKKNGGIRPAIDFRKLNAQCVDQYFPLASIQEALSSLANNAIFSTLDGQNAYHSIELDEEIKDLTGIDTTIGAFVCSRLPFGLSGATHTYSKAISQALEKIPPDTALPYLDDSIVAAKTHEEMLSKLDVLLKAFGDTGIILNAGKSKLFEERVNYLGHEISKQGIGTVREYVETIMKIPIPKTVTEAKSLQGKFGYYRRFIPDFSKIAAPIIEACVKAEKEGKAQLNPKDKRIINAVNALKLAITSSPILGHPQWNSDEKFRL